MPPKRKKPRPRKRSPLPFLILTAIVVAAAVFGFRLFFNDDDGGGTTARHRPVATATQTPEAQLSPAETPSPPAETAASPVPSAETTAPATPRAAASPPGSPTAAPGAPRLAIIIDDCGQWPAVENAFVALPYPLTLSVLPHVRYGTAIARAAQAAGKGVMLHLPMETLSGRYPGPGAVTTAMDDDTIENLVASDLADVPLARGVNNHEGSRATADTRVMNAVASVIAQNGGFFIDSRTNAKTVAESVAREHGIRAARRNVFLDDVDDVAAVEMQLRLAAQMAHDNGSAIAIGHPRQATLDAVRALAPEIQAGGITFVLASDLVH